MSPHLNIGEFVVFELPIPTLSDDSDFISGYLHKCVDAIKDMKKHYLRGEWTDMILARYQGKNKTRTLLPGAPSFREDAVLMYSLSVNFTNLMARKFERMNLK